MQVVIYTFWSRWQADLLTYWDMRSWTSFLGCQNVHNITSCHCLNMSMCRPVTYINITRCVLLTCYVFLHSRYSVHGGLCPTIIQYVNLLTCRHFFQRPLCGGGLIPTSHQYANISICHPLYIHVVDSLLVVVFVPRHQYVNLSTCHPHFTVDHVLAMFTMSNCHPL